MTSEESAGVRLPPPAIFFFALGGAWLLHRALPLHVLPGEWEGVREVAGFALVLAGSALAAGALVTLLRAGTSPHPTRPTTTLVTTGVYRLTRNPIYTGMMGVSTGIGLLTNSLWMAASVVPAFLALRWAVIAKEERYLTEKFGEVYREYCARVRRWL